MIPDKAHCLFEQSGTFRDEFIRLGIPAEDYDILNDFGKTDHIIDLFGEIDKAYRGEASIFDGITANDVVMAFFPCTRFEDQAIMLFRGVQYQMRDYTDEKKLEKALSVHDELSVLYSLICRLFIVCLRRGLRLIVENPYSTQHYLQRYFPVKPNIIDTDRTLSGDIYKKPTQYWFVNFEPVPNFVTEPLEIHETKKIVKENSVSRKVLRSMISPQYARRFILEYIIG